MADDAFALSPINARASLPTEADYEAISDAFMETARGRWFLGEYARRNRNADTRLVLEAVGRMETALTNQKSPERSLIDLLPVITDAIAEVRQRIMTALPKADSKPPLEPIQRAATLLRDVAWTLRESGAETRVCDLLDVQAKAIADGCVRIQGQASVVDTPALVAGALDSLAARISALVTSDERIDAGSSPRREPTASAAAAPAESAQPPAPVHHRAERAAPPPTEPIQAVAPPPMEAPAAVAEPPPSASAAKPLAAEPLAAEPLAAEPLAAEPLDAKIVEAKPVEPAPPAPVAEPPVNLWDDLEIIETVLGNHDLELVDTLPSSTPDVVVDHIAAPVAAPAPAPPPAPPQAVVTDPIVETSAPHSLGRAMMDSGMVANPAGPRSEALAAIRRMSQAEKIAFFS